MRQVKIGNRFIGDSYPVYIVAEIGINHNGDLDIARQLIDAAVHAGCDAVKFQKRNPDISVPYSQRDVKRETLWGYITYLNYRKRIEFGIKEYKEIDRYCKKKAITWFASCWDESSVDFLAQFNPLMYKIPSALLTHRLLLKHISHSGRPVILSTGMSTMTQINRAIKLLNIDNLILTHATSAYPCPPEELNLQIITTLRKRFSFPIGYSGHEVGLTTTIAAVALGACYIERHITLDRSMWGSDQAASVEPAGFERLVKYIRILEKAMGDGVKRVWPSELLAMKRLRKNE